VPNQILPILDARARMPAILTQTLHMTYRVEKTNVFYCDSILDLRLSYLVFFFTFGPVLLRDFERHP